MTENGPRETPMLAPENLPLDLGELGAVIEADLVIPGVYDAILRSPEAEIGIEAYIVLKDAAEISKSAKRYGKAAPDYPDLLVYSADDTGNTCYIISYELDRYRSLHQIPVPEDELVRTTAAIGAEMYPGYFGRYPVPYFTPWGCTTRSKVIANGLYWLETEKFQRGLAVSFPKFDDLSKSARGLAEPFDDGSAKTNGEVPGYLFFNEADSSVPLFELVVCNPLVQVDCAVDQAALMNAIWKFHPEYAMNYNAHEQAGLHDMLGLLLCVLGDEDRELDGSLEHMITMNAKAGFDFIEF